MHLLPADAAASLNEDVPVDLDQAPAELVVASFADTELACLAAALDRLAAAAPDGGLPETRLAPLRLLRHPMSVDLWVERTLAHARLVVLRLIGGRSYWSYGLEQVVAACRAQGVALAVLPGDDRPDPSLDGWSTLPRATCELLWQCLAEGGVENASRFLANAVDILAGRPATGRATPLPRIGLYRAGRTFTAPHTAWANADPPVRAVVLFYRAMLLAGDLQPVDRLIEALAGHGIGAVGLFVSSLKNPAEAALAREWCQTVCPGILLTATGFATASAETGWTTPFDALDVPVIQLVLAGCGEPAWRDSPRGLPPVDLAMQVALPELDGRLHGPVIAFKDGGSRHEPSQCRIVRWQASASGIARAAAQAAAWLRLRDTPPRDRRVALVLANYPVRDGRLANGVGLDTPASAIAILKELKQAGYNIQSIADDGDALIRSLQTGVTNVPPQADLPADGKNQSAEAEEPAGTRRQVRVRVELERYRDWFARLPDEVQGAVTERWGSAEADPFCRDGALLLPVLPLGQVVVALQPARGYEIDPATSWHDPALVPPHRYLAFYLWLRHGFAAHAVVQVGKHGNLEWLPGKATGLSDACHPAALLGPMPLVYPFIVNDPGEGSQAKRRTSAVIIDHLTPPLVRAGLHGDLQTLENLLDEYAEARDLDPKRAGLVARSIVEEASRLRLDRDLAASGGRPDDEVVALDAWLCELKELQIRDGLHVLGQSPSGRQRAELLASLARLPRGSRPGDASLTRALAADLGLTGFDPLAADGLAAPWSGPRPAVLAELLPAPWRTAGDTVERLEALALALLAEERPAPPAWTATAAVLAMLQAEIAPALDRSGPAELAALLAALDGRFVRPGPSGAPSRGRPDVLPTGRNFFSVDCRALPTPAAWRLGWASAGAVLQHYAERHGEWPKALVLSAWGTANMRTGGDDIAQALALLGCRPVWDGAGGRVTGVEVIPLDQLGRPRVDVTFRVSGFFRDAFPQQIELIDQAARLVAGLDEPADQNPLAAHVAAEVARLAATGEPPERARLRASARVFGSRPGAYGAGLQALIDERHWQDDGDLAAAYLAWGAHAYGSGREGLADGDQLRRRLEQSQLVLHNQDNREHDLLDSDDYYQFEGGVIAAIRHFSGRQPEAFHVDHSRPEAPRPRRLAEEISRIVRGRAANPRWIQGAMRHGYKGAFEMVATVDYLFAFAATARVVEDHHFDQLFDAYLEDTAVREFLQHANPEGLREMAARFAEAIDRGLWHPARNSVAMRLADLLALPVSSG